MNTIAEISESEASGQVAMLYADIRTVTGLPLVNLVYRHLATDAKVLDWAWQAIRPNILSGLLPAQAAHLAGDVETIIGRGRQRLSLPDGFPVSDVFSLVRIYGRGNSLNMMAFTHILAAYEEQSGSRSTSNAPLGRNAAHSLHAPAMAAAPSSAMPQLPAMSDIAGPDKECIHRLNALAEPERPLIVASLYRHLAVWPAMLAAAENLLQPMEQAGLLSAARMHTHSAALRIAEGNPMPMPAVPVEFLHNFQPLLQIFVRRTICKMIPIGAFLQQALRQSLPHIESDQGGSLKRDPACP